MGSGGLNLPLLDLIYLRKMIYCYSFYNGAIDLFKAIHTGFNKTSKTDSRYPIY
jgi:hypothetical protein